MRSFEDDRRVRCAPESLASELASSKRINLSGVRTRAIADSGRFLSDDFACMRQCSRLYRSLVHLAHASHADGHKEFVRPRRTRQKETLGNLAQFSGS